MEWDSGGRGRTGGGGRPTSDDGRPTTDGAPGDGAPGDGIGKGAGASRNTWVRPGAWSKMPCFGGRGPGYGRAASLEGGAQNGRFWTVLDQSGPIGTKMDGSGRLLARLARERAAGAPARRAAGATGGGGGGGGAARGEGLSGALGRGVDPARRGIDPARRRIGRPRRAEDGLPDWVGEFELQNRPPAGWGAGSSNCRIALPPGGGPRRRRRRRVAGLAHGSSLIEVNARESAIFNGRAGGRGKCAEIGAAGAASRSARAANDRAARAGRPVRLVAAEPVVHRAAHPPGQVAGGIHRVHLRPDRGRADGGDLAGAPVGPVVDSCSCRNADWVRGAGGRPPSGLAGQLEVTSGRWGRASAKPCLLVSRLRAGSWA